MTILSKLTSNGNENTVNVLKNIANAVVIKGGGIIVGLLTTPAYMDYFSKNEILGIWFTILSVVTWMLNFDLGIGNGLRNRLVEEFACSNDQKIIKCLKNNQMLNIFCIWFFIKHFRLSWHNRVVLY